MNKQILLFFAPLLSLFLTACGPGKTADADDPYDPVYRDTLQLTGDLTLVQENRLAPSNSAFRVYDKKGRERLIGGSCSECYLDYVIRYDYAPSGVFSGFSDGYLYIDIKDTAAMQQLASFLSGHDTFLFREDEDDAETIGLENRYVFTYDENKRLTGVTDPAKGSRLTAPEGYSIDYEIQPGLRFWESDLDGGKYNLMFYIKPVPAAKNPTYSATYIGYHLCMTTCRAENSTTSVLYGREGELVTKRVWTDLGERQAYEQTDGAEEETRKIEWENDRPVSDRLISRWGTVLRETTYRYAKGKVQRTTSAYDYTAKQLQLEQDTTVSIEEIAGLSPTRLMDLQDAYRSIYEY